MRAKYDWKDLKLEFFQSEYDEVKSFINDKNMTYNSVVRKYTKGWSNEKQQYKERILKKALERKEKEEAKNLEIDMNELKKAKKASVKLLMKKLSDIIEGGGEVNVKDVERILKMIKTELGEPTSISKNDTTLRGEPLDESLFIQD